MSVLLVEAEHVCNFFIAFFGYCSLLFGECSLESMLTAVTFHETVCHITPMNCDYEREMSPVTI